jgi:hypothetical protein
MLEAMRINLCVRVLIRLPYLVSQATLSTRPTGRAKMFALETVAGESNSLFLMLRACQYQGYDDVVDDAPNLDF